MLVPDRRRRLVEHLHRSGSAQVEDLADALGVSTSTVRRDLADLEAEGRLRRAHGGAYLHRATLYPETRPQAAPETDDVKRRIGKAAADRLTDGTTVMILGGSTTAAMLPFCAGHELTVVTNGLDVAHTLAEHPDITVVVLGGVLHREQLTLLGPMTEQNMADLHVDVMFAGAFGVHPQGGVTGTKIMAAGSHHSMLRHAEELVVLADAAKLGRQGPTLLAEMDQVHTLVTDRAADEQLVEAIRRRGTHVEVC
ncbi:DeoR/GlpR family DNA-binding transcription regulator [uncultured Jatrophihabitans sp.]|uniref:DeoR/GlpR family DNA-binding transcription regulator n=1 Tax=uncultured Jatrophihabitans sp. TaxID=1610747 RepID=UPI0035C9FB02